MIKLFICIYNYIIHNKTANQVKPERLNRKVIYSLKIGYIMVVYKLRYPISSRYNRAS